MSLEEIFKQRPEDAANCLKFCSDYIGGPWSDLSLDDFDCKFLPGGLCNRVFICKNKKLEGKGTVKMPEKVLLRTYGSDFVGRRGDMIQVDDAAHAVIPQILFNNNLGTKTYGVWDGGRIEEFIEHDDIPASDRHELKYCEAIMKKIAIIHDLEMPISKNPYAVYNLIRNWYQDGKNNNQFLFKANSVKPELEAYRIECSQFDWSSEMDWFKSCIPLVQSRQVFNHNDIQYANIFLRKNGSSIDDNVYIFDYENCSYGFRGYDLAFFLYGKSIDFYVDEYWKNVFWPEESVRRHLLSIYLAEHVKRLETVNPELDCLEHLMLEVDFFHLLVMLLRTCVCYKKVNDKFQECLHLSHHEINMFHEKKKLLLEKYPFLGEKIVNGK